MHPLHRRQEYLEKKNQEARAYWESLGHTVLTMHAPHGGTVELSDDIDKIYVDISQKWVPVNIHDSTHPAKVGDIVTPNQWLSERSGLGVSFVSGVRTRRTSRRCNGVRQIELLGMPFKWIAIGHFEEYKNSQISDHLWGHAFNRDPAPLVTVLDPKTGHYVTGPQIRQPIFANQ